MYDGIEFRTGNNKKGHSTVLVLTQLFVGDLILYEGIGITSNVTKLLHGSPYSNIGIVLQLPNKWTKVTFNNDSKCHQKLTPNIETRILHIRNNT